MSVKNKLLMYIHLKIENKFHKFDKI